MSKLIIGIHGLANKPERAVLETYWRDGHCGGSREELRHKGASVCRAKLP